VIPDDELSHRLTEALDVEAAKAPMARPEWDPEPPLWVHQEAARPWWKPGLVVAAAVIAVAVAAVALTSTRHARPTTTVTTSPSPPANSASATITGLLVDVTGPPPGTAHAVAGAVEIRREDGTTFTALAGQDGRFAIRVRAGLYTLVGRQHHDNTFGCLPTAPASVTVGGTIQINVACIARPHPPPSVSAP
jgi:hypothetical protein